MKLSDKTDELFKALSKFQGELENATKNAVNPGVKNKYADLAECINTAKPVLAGNGLAVIQMIGSNEEAKQTLITMLTHESGQFMSSEFVMADAVLMGGAGKNPVQALGSAITYQRRYAFAAIVGMAQEDDDGNANTRVKTQQQAKPQTINDSQQACLRDLIEDKNYTVDGALGVWNIKSLSEIQTKSYQQFVDIVDCW